MRIAIAISGPLDSHGANRVATAWGRVLADAGADVSLVYERGGDVLAAPEQAAAPYDAPAAGTRFGRVAARRRGAVAALGRLEAERPLDLLLTHDPVISAAARRALPRTPLLQSFHSCFVEENRLNNWKYAGPARRLSYPATRWLASRAERQALAGVDAVHTLSHDTWNRLRARHPAACSRLLWRRIPGTVDARFRPSDDRGALRRRLGLPEDEVVLLSVRRLVPRNAVERILHCAHALRDRAFRVRFVVIGRGPEEARLRAEAERLGLGDRVRIQGFVPEAELPAWYQAADAFLLPSRDLECFGMSVIEAMACGCLPLVTPLGGPLELVPDPALAAEENSGRAFTALVARYLEGSLRVPGPPALAAHTKRHYSERAIRPAVLALVEQATKQRPRR